MIDIGQWRVRIGQFIHHCHPVSVNVVLVYWDGGRSWSHLTPVCVLVVAAVLLMGGDVETNPGPKKKSGVYEYTYCN